MFSRFARYVQDTRREMAHVSWPTRAQTVGFTIMVLGISVFVAIYLSIFDFGFTQGLRAMLEYAPQFTESSSIEVTTDASATTSATSSTDTGSLPEFTVTPIVDDSPTNTSTQ